MPQRTCVGCRTVRPQDGLVRFALAADGTVLASRTAPGRGAWLCAGSASCLDIAVKRNGFGRAFRTPVRKEAVSAVRLEGPVPADERPSDAETVGSPGPRQGRGGLQPR